jgi:hypothetical protein
LSGERTEDKPLAHYGRASFKGIKNHYLKKVHGNDIASLVLICDYNNMAHDAVLSNFAGSVTKAENSCPVAPNGLSAVVVAP